MVYHPGTTVDVFQDVYVLLANNGNDDIIEEYETLDELLERILSYSIM